MRISTSMIYGLGGKSVSAQTTELYKLQSQLSSGKRVNTPADDPLASARILEIGQSKSTSDQLSTNADYATSALNAQESALSDISDLLSSVRSLGVYAGNPSLTVNDKQVLATSLKSKYNELLSLVNTQDNGKYLFSGFQGETQPFSEVTPGVVAYNGDEGQRLIQVSPSRQVPVSSAGIEVFQRIKNGNGTFSVSADPNITGVTNTGTGVATPGAILDPTKWNAATIPADTAAPFSATNPGPGGFKVVFNQDSTVNPPVTSYDIVAITNGTVVNGVTYNAGQSLLTGAASTTLVNTAGATVYPATYTSGTTISFNGGPTSTVNAPFTANASTWDLGSEFSVSGSPASGDTFTVRSSVNDQDIFSTIYKLINNLQGGSPTAISNSVATMLQDLNFAEESVSTALTTVGVTAKEVDSHKSTNDDLSLQYKTEISHLEDLDYATAITDLNLRQTVLQAAQQSFIKIQGLTLFNFIQ